MAWCSSQGGFLEAQTVLSQQARQRRQAQLRQAREQRRHKVYYAVNGTVANDSFHKQS